MSRDVSRLGSLVMRVTRLQVLLDALPYSASMSRIGVSCA
jgi:hypothetical protein